MVVWMNTSFSQNCYQTEIVLNSQAQVNSFASYYTGFQAFNSSITISGADIVNLNGLSPIHSIGWGLKIQNTSLTNVEGLNNLTFVGGY